MDAEQRAHQEDRAAEEALEQDGAAGPPPALDFPVIGIGASAGGLRAYETFFDEMHEATGMAFVLVQHLDPHHQSELAELLQNHTRMPVLQVEDGTNVKPDHVYVIPPGTSLTIEGGVLHLSDPVKRRGHRAPIDLFFRSLAEDQGERAVAVVLSGTGSDGTLGLKAVKERAGITMAQDPDDAEYDGMPRSAIATGLVDVALPAGELARKLVEYSRNADRIRLPKEPDALPDDEADALQKIFAQLRSRTGHDFSPYKRSTILRRIGRRLHVTQIADLPSYHRYLREHPPEADALFKDFLISVTNFFRDTDAFQVLEKKAIPALFEGKGASDQVRVWVPGCATGEEAYSIAILLCEHAATLNDPPDLQVFATDIDPDAIAFARDGRYAEALTADVAPERLQRFFTERSGGYEVQKGLREIVLFAVHNLIKDPPFSKIDLISCRNLLIYLNRDVQRRVFELFHYALHPGGHLFLGNSETIADASALFATVSKKQRLYRSRAMPATAPRLPRLPLAGGLDTPRRRFERPTEKKPDFEVLHQQLLLEAYAPPSVLVSDNYDLVHVSTGASRYLQVAEGMPTHNVLNVVHPGLRIELRTALFTAFRNEHPLPPRRVRFELNGEPVNIRLSVHPLSETPFDGNFALVIFEEVEPLETEMSTLESSGGGGESSEVVEQLEAELQRTTQRLQTTVEEYETSNEELKASNEELQSMNEEMQSTTEELETAKEELQSMNEELITVNQELKTKIEELTRSNSDLRNLMDATDIGTLFLNRELRLKLYTPRITEVFNVLDSDVGRPLAHLTHLLDYGDLAQDARRVLDDLMPIEREVAAADDRWFLLRLRPYRTLDDRIDGVVITLVDLTERKRAEERDRFQSSILTQINDAVIALGPERRVIYFNEAAGAMLGVDPAEALGQPLDTLYTYEWPRGEDEAAIVASLEADGAWKGEVVLIRRDREEIPAELNVSALLGADGRRTGSLAVIRDIRARREAEAARQESERRLYTLFSRSPVYIAMHEGPDHTYIFSNPMHDRVVGGRDLIGKPLRTAMQELEGQGIFARFDRVYETGEPDVVREMKAVFYRDGDGELQTGYFDQVLEPWFWPDGTVRGVMSFAFEVTDAVRARNEVQQRARQQAAVAQLGLQALQADDLKALFDAAVDTASETLGTDFSKVLRLLPGGEALHLEAGRGWTEGLVGTADIPAGNDSQAGYTLRSSEPVIVEDLRTESRFSGPALLTDHGVVSGLSVVIWNGQEPWGVFGTHTAEHRVFSEQDVSFVQAIANLLGEATARRRAETALREAKERFENVAETVPNIIFTADADVQVTYINQRWTEWTGAPAEAAMGGEWAAYLHEDDLERATDAWKQALETGGLYEVRERLRTADGTYRWVIVRATPVRHDGEIVRWLGTVTDIDDLVHAEQAVKALNETLEGRVRERTEQVRALASALTLAEQHERRRIAQILHDDLQQMLYGLELTTQQVRRAETEDTRARFLDQLNEILDRAIDTTRTLTVELSPPVLRGEGLEDALQWLAVHMEKTHDLTVEVTAAERILIESEDLRVLLFQLVRELLFNVVKHAGVDHARITAEVNDEGVTLCIEDEGVGFDPASLEEPDQLDDGFGLVSVRERLRLFGGRLVIESVPGEGTCMTIVAPLLPRSG